jgi:hypothetical protein
MQRFAGEFVFPDASGEPIEPSAFGHRFDRVLRRAGLRGVRFDLRHTYASLLIAAGAHPKYIQAQMGYASITIRDDWGLVPRGGGRPRSLGSDQGSGADTRPSSPYQLPWVTYIANCRPQGGGRGSRPAPVPRAQAQS